jgi:SNF2 family DNA or RNA helicase
MGAVTQAEQKALQAPFRSGVEIEEYQLDPVARALTMPRVNLLVADDVGLGKTVEAGLVVQEMILRHRIRTVLVVCPSSLQVQWKEEMRDKFGLEFRIIDSETIGQLRRKRGIHVNPWTHFPRLITSLDFLKQDRILRTFRDTLPDNGTSYPRAYDLLIIDEAHNIAPSGTGKYAKESLRTQTIRTLVPHFEHKLFLSATPHNGYRESFTALLEMLDVQRFARNVPPDPKQLEAVMIRRLKTELRARWDGSSRFKNRVVNHLEVAYSDEERAAHTALKRYTELRIKNARTLEEKVAAEFVLKLLKKRLFSSPAAFAKTLAKHLASLEDANKTSASVSTKALQKQFGLLEEDFSDDDELETTTDEVVSMASETFSVGAEERELLGRLERFAEQSHRADSKAQALLSWLKDNIRSERKRWTDKRVIIFTEYRDTQKWLSDLLAREGFAEDDRLELIYGGMELDERERIKAAFQANPKDAKV